MLACAALIPFVGLRHALWEVDDARYAEVPREMVERGEYVTPSLNYLPYVEKPPLPYWVACASYKLFGASEASAHLALAFWALLALAATAWLGSWLFSPATGLAGAAMLGTCASFIALSHLATPDLPLTASLAWTTALWLRALLRPGDAWWAGTAAGACMGLAVLCKGLVGVVFPVAWVGALALAVPETRPGLVRSLKSGLIPAFLLVGLPWWVVMERRHPGFLRFVIGEQHFQRFLAGAAKYKRAGPVWYYLPVEILGLVPWTPLVGAGLAGILLRWRSADPGLRALGLWTLGVLAFFSISSSKLPTYILPIFPHQALVAAAFLLGRGPDAREPRLRGLSLGLGLTLVLAVPIVPIAAGRMEGAPLPAGVPWLMAAAALAFAAGTLALCLPWPKPRLAGPAAGGAIAALLILRAATVGEAWLSAKPIAEAINLEIAPGDRILSYDTYLHGLAFYTGRPVDVVNWVGELHYAKRDPANAARFGDDNLIRSLPEPGRATFVALRRRNATWLTSLTTPEKIGQMRTFGPWALAVFRERQGDRRSSPASAPGPSPSR